MSELLIVLIILIIIVLIFFYPSSSVNNREYFDADGVEFLPLGEDQYGLRGDRLNIRSIDNHYISPYRQIRLSFAGGDMWEASTTPEEQGFTGCYQTPCPCGTDYYDDMDTCWMCNDGKLAGVEIPSYSIHTKI